MSKDGIGTRDDIEFRDLETKRFREEKGMETKQWFAIFAQTLYEGRVKDKLVDLLGDKAKPVIVKRKLKERKKGIWTEVEKNLYPGYILLYGQIDKYDCKDINKIPNVIKVLCNDGSPTPIAKNEIHIIEKLIDINGIIDFSTGIIKDSKVIITDGPLKDFQGLVKKVDKRKHRAKVVLQFLGEERTVDFGVNILEKVE